MDIKIKLFLTIAGVLQGNGVSLRRQLEHIVEKKLESQGIPIKVVPSRRTFYKYDPRELSPILGAPSMPSHLPEAEPILPGHTLIKPALGMLKSSVKFPHVDFEDGAGVYGNADNIGIRYDSKNERVLYSGFRRMPYDYIVVGLPRTGNTTTGTGIYNSNLPLTYKIFRVEKPKSKNQVTNLEPRRDGENGDNDLQKTNENDNEKYHISKKTFDHIVINQNAPDFADIFPNSMIDQQRPWWFYNEGDS